TTGTNSTGTADGRSKEEGPRPNDEGPRTPRTKDGPRPKAEGPRTLELSQRRRDRQPRGANGRPQPADETHHERVRQPLNQKWRCHRKSERDLAERLKIHRGCLVAVEPEIREHPAGEPAESGKRQRFCQRSEERRVGKGSK